MFILYYDGITEHGKRKVKDKMCHIIQFCAQWEKGKRMKLYFMNIQMNYRIK